MINVVVITPYPELSEMAYAMLGEHANPGIHCEVLHAFGTRVGSLDLGEPDIILARGLTRTALKNKYKNSTVLEFSVSAYDILRAIHECRKTHRAKRIAVLGQDTLLYDVDTLKEIINVDIRIFPIHDETDIRAALATAKEERFDAIVGGLTAARLAPEFGLASTFIKTSEESFHIAVKEALNTAQVMFTERAKNEITQAILQNAKTATVYFDHTCVVTQCNKSARDILALPYPPMGREVAEIFRDQELIDLVRSRGARQGVIKKAGGADAVFDVSPVRVGEQVIGVICTFQRVHEIQDTESMIRKQLNKKGLYAKYGFANIIHASDGLAKTIATANKYAGVDANVLLIGETGTGKELFAQSIHSASNRHLRPFVAVNCAAFPENLLESELFGYADGAFSGASKGGKTGLFELAHNGTLFLDEIGEIPLTLQATLLRALQEKEIRRIGDDKVIPVNVRIVAATNRDLRGKVKAGEFRMDLLYRLDVLSLFIPPLRERKEDIRLIAEHYLNHYCGKYGKPAMRLDGEVVRVLEAYPWPGNTRELRNICERLVVLIEDGEGISAKTLEGLLRVGSELPEAFGAEEEEDDVREPKGMEELVEFAQTMKVNREDIANMLGISRTTLWRRMKKERMKQQK